MLVATGKILAEDQNVDSGEIAPDISAIADTATTSEDTEVEISTVEVSTEE